jgi:hypothetical protein
MTVITILGIVVIVIILIPAGCFLFLSGARAYYNWKGAQNIKAYQKITEEALADVQKRYIQSAREVERDLKRLQDDLMDIQNQPPQEGATPNNDGRTG